MENAAADITLLQHHIRSTTILEANSEIRTYLENLWPGVRQPLVFAQLKGYASRLKDQAYHKEALKYLTDENVNVVTWDGDWYKDDSFSSLVKAFLEANTAHRAVAFRKDSQSAGSQKRMQNSWRVIGNLHQLAMLLVRTELITDARRELEARGEFTDELLDYTALGWMTARCAGAKKILAIGGANTTLAEATVYRWVRERYGHSGSLPDWKLIWVTRPSQVREPPVKLSSRTQRSLLLPCTPPQRLLAHRYALE